jgi:1,4-alpha-glucan branching enzyme
MTSTIEFQLFAPYNTEATLIGNFSNWEDVPMEKHDDGYFRTTVELDDGEYQYKFRVRSKSYFFEPDQWVYVVDPYGTTIEPSQANCIICVENGKRVVDTYIWQHDDTPLPNNEELIFYEMHVADFSGGEPDSNPRGKFKDVIDKLDYLSDLGINAIELMPIMEFPGDYSWGYNPRYFFAVESSYGTTAEFKQLVDECHGRGIRVFLDLLINHSEAEHPLTQIDHDYWYHHETRHPDNSWGPEFNYEHYDENFEVFPARKYIRDMVHYWMEEYHIDGFRYDAARQIENYDFMHEITAVAQDVAKMKPFYNVAEHIPETPDITNTDGPMDGCWHESFSQTIKRLILDGDFDLDTLKEAIDGKRQGYQGAVNMVNYLTSHDQERLMVELSNREMFGKETFTRIKLGFALLMTSVGIPLILMGEEFGEYKPLKPEPNELDWTVLEEENNQDIWNYCRGLIQLRKNNHALRTNNIEFFYEDPEAKVFAYTRWNDEGSRVVVVVNGSDRFLEGYEVSHFPEDGKWHEWTLDYDVEVQEGRLIVDLGEYEAKVFVWG